MKSNTLLLRLLGFASCIAALPEPQPLITEAPALATLYERDNEAPSFMGYVADNTTYKETACARGYYSSAGRNAGCVTDNTRPVATGCTSSTLVVYPNGDNATCTGSYTCSYHTIFDNLDQKSTWSRWACFVSGNTNKVIVYRATTHVSSTSTTSEISTTTDQSATTGESTESAASATATSDSGTDGSSGGSKSMAWVAGPVVGGVAGLAIIGLLVWVVLLLKRRNANKGVEAAPDPNYNNNLPPGSNMSQMYPSPQVTPAAGYADPVGEPYKYYPQGPPQSLYASPPPQGGYSQVPTQAAELHSTSSQGPWMSPAPSELPASESHGARSDAAELGGSDVRR
ncbi:unnamed protein product [Clonostachys rosea f. rosea IK726]|uniref:Uncharacterized protein n=1 Tax=Clonostachys rosea f. rosea IK726 TaxID=1349383 RepID=A0ACA9TUX7_BIOOC|nr:unnamed protein product [Clonostachys rosea f. rosea IK726]